MGEVNASRLGPVFFMGDIDDDAEPHSSFDPLTLVSVGIPCTDHSALGARSRFLGPTALGAIVFSQERRYRQREEHFVFTECAPDWEPLALKGALYPKSTVQPVNAQLHDFNFPVFRERALSLANHNSLSRFVMSFEEFLQKFKQPPVHKGKYLDVEQQVVVQQELDARSRDRSICCIGLPTFETHTLTAPQQVRLQAYRLNAVRRQGTKRVSANRADGWIAAFGQNEDATSRLSTCLLTILTHGSMWCEAPGISRPAMKFEHLSFQQCRACRITSGHLMMFYIQCDHRRSSCMLYLQYRRPICNTWQATLAQSNLAPWQSCTYCLARHHRHKCLCCVRVFALFLPHNKFKTRV